jgi:O-antigen/teichoic acid export membrane protein
MNDTDKYFKTEHLKKDLKGRAVRGLGAVFGARGIMIMIELAGTMILARLLFPEDYGLVAMVAVVVNFAIIFRDIGLSSATVWAEDISHQLITNMFWISVSIGLILMLIIAVLSPVIAWFYQEPKLIGITLAMLPTFIFSSAMLQHQALLKRQMRFGRLALVQVVASGGGLILAILFALKGVGYWTLIIQKVATSILFALGIWSACRWVPGLPRKSRDTMKFLHFGGNISAGRLIQYLLRNADNMLLGYYVGSKALGLYAKAYALLMLPLGYINEPFSQVVIPALSRLQKEPERFRNYYKRAIATTSMLSVPIAVFCAVAARDVIRVLLGAKWDSAATVFIYLVPLAFLGAFNVASGWIYISLGLVRRQLKVRIITGILGIMSMFIGVQWGLYGMAIAVSTISIIVWLPSMLYCYKGTPVSIKDLFSALFKPVISSFVAAIIVLVTASFFDISGPGIVSLIIKTIVFGTVYGVSFLLLPGGKEIIVYYLQTVGIIRK